MFFEWLLILLMFYCRGFQSALLPCFENGCTCSGIPEATDQIEVWCQDLGKTNKLPEHLPRNIRDLTLRNIDLGPKLLRNFFKTSSANLSALHSLKLDGVNVREFQQGCFAGLESLTVLRVDGPFECSYLAFPRGLFLNVPQLERLEIFTTTPIDNYKTGTFMDETIGDLKQLRFLTIQCSCTSKFCTRTMVQ